MSTPGEPLSKPPSAELPRELQGRGCLPVLLGLIGVLLLLPGICSFLFMLVVRPTPGLWALWLATYVVAAAGIVLIVYVSRKKPH
jgi:hypothetical protein